MFLLLLQQSLFSLIIWLIKMTNVKKWTKDKEKKGQGVYLKYRFSSTLLKSISIMAHCLIKLLILKHNFMMQESKALHKCLLKVQKHQDNQHTQKAYCFLGWALFKFSSTLFHLLQSISTFCSYLRKVNLGQRSSVAIVV